MNFFVLQPDFKGRVFLDAAGRTESEYSMTSQSEQLDEAIDELTHQMTEAMGSEEKITYNQTLNQNVTVFGKSNGRKFFMVDLSRISLPKNWQTRMYSEGPKRCGI